MTRVTIPACWCYDGLNLAEYMTEKGYTMSAQATGPGVVYVYLEEDLDEAQKSVLAADIRSDLNSVSFG